MAPLMQILTPGKKNIKKQKNNEMKVKQITAEVSYFWTVQYSSINLM